jgi:AraC family transcriptional regulator
MVKSVSEERSIKNVHYAPKNYRGERIERIVYEKQNINEKNLSHIIQGIEKNPKLINVEEIKLIGFSAKTSIKNNRIPYVWNLYRENSDQIKSVSPDNSTIGLYEKPLDYAIEKFSEETEMNLIYGKVVDDLSNIPDKMVAGIIPQGRYAKFTHTGSVHSIRLSYVYIFGTWLPKSGHTLSVNPDFERFGDRFLGSFNEKSEIDICIAIA